MDRGAWWARVHGIAKELDTTEHAHIRMEYSRDEDVTVVSITFSRRLLPPAARGTYTHPCTHELVYYLLSLAQLGFNPNIQPRIVVNTQTDNTCQEKKENDVVSKPFYFFKCFMSLNASKHVGAALFPDLGVGHTTCTLCKNWNCTFMLHVLFCMYVLLQTKDHLKISKQINALLG